MPTLAEAYHAAHPPDRRRPPEQPAVLDSTLAALCARGRAAWPDLPLSDLDFVRYLAACGAPVAGGPNAAHAADLFLACCALAGTPAAVETLRRDHRPVLARYLRRLDMTATAFDEVEQALWATLLAASPAGPAKLALYTGKGPLASFIGIAAQRIALDSRRRQAAEGRARAGLMTDARAFAEDVETAFARWRYKKGFEQAVGDALGVLSDRERMLLRMRVVDGLTVQQIAKVYGATQPTASRWLEKAHKTVLVETRRLLCERLLVSETEFDSIAGLIVSQLDVSVSRILRGVP